VAVELKDVDRVEYYVRALHPMSVWALEAEGEVFL